MNIHCMADDDTLDIGNCRRVFLEAYDCEINCHFFVLSCSFLFNDEVVVFEFASLN